MTPTSSTNSTRLQKVVIAIGILLAVVFLGMSHYHHVQIVTKVAADNSFNWGVANTELGLGIVSAIGAIVLTWLIPQQVVSVAVPVAATSDAGETSTILLQKLEHRFRLEAVDAVQTQILKGGAA